MTGPSAIAYGHRQEAVTIDDFLVNKDGSNNLLPKPFASAFGTLRLLSGGKVRVVDVAAFAAAHPQPASSLGTIPGETPYDSDPYDVVAYRGGGSAGSRVALLRATRDRRAMRHISLTDHGRDAPARGNGQGLARARPPGTQAILDTRTPDQPDNF